MDVAAPELLMQLFLQYGAMQGGGIIQGTINGRPIVQPVPVQLQMSAVQKREQERLAQQREQVARRLQRV
ncbi:MAG TPA: hypothetical protein VLG71_01420, partial [Candidatus Limnocylindria bacterium]|nr:hypothetical protein [Candidatus Limnocylindria bacterium]